MKSLTSDEKKYYALVDKAFGILAPIYDAITLPFLPARETVVDFAGPRSGAKVLDVATGTGAQAFAFGRRGFEVIGVDLTVAMLQVARKKNRSGNVNFEAGDATRLRFGSDSFDIVCISFALHDMLPTIRERALNEMVRVVKPDGTIVIVDYALPGNEVGRRLIYSLVKLYEGEYYREFIRSDLPALLAQAGIEITETRPILLGAGRILKGRKTVRLQI